MENPFGITKEDVINLAAQKIADEYCSTEEVSDIAANVITQRINDVLAAGLKERIDSFLREEMEKLVSQEIFPVDIWGERAGGPTTIRAELAKRAREFWNVKVDMNGKESGWGGTERSKVMMQQIVKDEFANAVKEHSDVIVAEFKAALKENATKLVAEHIDKLINVKSR